MEKTILTDVSFNPSFEMFIVYKGAMPFPDKYIARRWHLNQEGQAIGRDVVAVAADLEVVRNTMRRWGLAQIDRDTSDEPCVVESWV